MYCSSGKQAPEGQAEGCENGRLGREPAPASSGGADVTAGASLPGENYTDVVRTRDCDPGCMTSMLTGYMYFGA